MCDLSLDPVSLSDMTLEETPLLQTGSEASNSQGLNAVGDEMSKEYKKSEGRERDFSNNNEQSKNNPKCNNESSSGSVHDIDEASEIGVSIK